MSTYPRPSNARQCKFFSVGDTEFCFAVLDLNVSAVARLTPLSLLGIFGIDFGRNERILRASSTEDLLCFDDVDDAAVEDEDVLQVLSLRSCKGSPSSISTGSFDADVRGDDEEPTRVDASLSARSRRRHLAHMVSTVSTPRSFVSQHPRVKPGCDVARMHGSPEKVDLPQQPQRAW